MAPKKQQRRKKGNGKKKSASEEVDVPASWAELKAAVEERREAAARDEKTRLERQKHIQEQQDNIIELYDQMAATAAQALSKMVSFGKIQSPFAGRRNYGFEDFIRNSSSELLTDQTTNANVDFH